MKLINTFRCQDDDGAIYEVEEYAEVQDASHMQGGGQTIYGMREYRTKDGLGLRPLGGGRFYCQTLLKNLQTI
ncbi:hypothetical protein [Paracoccus sp. SM22M-07]|uniref:hypothetical protein n=1 Tax=Paracoccus sp. SM22M-07 TaxID=1520813 RepID=UPI000919AC47|nr:hypothetical protein [Paracoccus sp. SM22M-07]OJH45831.1 hypothetical protein IE00_00885 [Paracoccus sp. SM22M-07]